MPFFNAIDNTNPSPSGKKIFRLIKPELSANATTRFSFNSNEGNTVYFENIYCAEK